MRGGGGTRKLSHHKLNQSLSFIRNLGLLLLLVLTISVVKSRFCCSTYCNAMLEYCYIVAAAVTFTGQSDHKHNNSCATYAVMITLRPITGWLPHFLAGTREPSQKNCIPPFFGKLRQKLGQQCFAQRRRRGRGGWLLFSAVNRWAIEYGCLISNL